MYFNENNYLCTKNYDNEKSDIQADIIIILDDERWTAVEVKFA